MSELWPTLLFQTILGSFITTMFRNRNLQSFMEPPMYLCFLPVKTGLESCFPRPLPVAFRSCVPIARVGPIWRNYPDFLVSFVSFTPMIPRRCVAHLRKHL